MDQAGYSGLKNLRSLTVGVTAAAVMTEPVWTLAVLVAI